jgi:glutamyl-tRNA synthetase
MGSSNMDNLALGLKGADYKALESIFLELDLHLTLRTYLDGYQLGLDDTEIWTNIRMSKVAYAMVRKGQFDHVTRWFSYIEAVYPEI